MNKSNIASTLKSLRLGHNLTQKKLAQETGLSLSSIISYENGLREPNSKAMAILEKYFNVSGEYLRGEAKKVEFFEKNNIVNSKIESVNNLLREFNEEYIISSQEEQIYIADMEYIFFKNIIEIIKSENRSILPEVVNDFFNVCTTLNEDGQKEMINRAKELACIDKFKNV